MRVNLSGLVCKIGILVNVSVVSVYDLVIIIERILCLMT